MNHTVHAVRRLATVEARLFLRDPLTAFFSLVFPVLLLVVLGCIPALRRTSPDLHGMSTIQLYAPILAVFTLLLLGLNGLPSLLAAYRERGVLRRMSASPVRPGLLFGALVPMYVGIASVSVLLVVLGGLALGVPLPRQPLGFLLAFVLAAAAMMSVGLLIAAFVPSAKAGNAVGALAFFPMMFFSGIWLPREMSPALLDRIGDFTPSGAAVQALQDSWNGHFPHAVALLTLAAYAVLAGGAAAKLFRWE
ncbi:ABC transporter permease [Streptomyces sp. SP17BM10]|uniref:ABC transporter permease n=1 Tax=Streptomyces sp. SP17BM10 TaxID=3002530 RepID=UPI002E77FD0D|nr:ABC transporter permease [Streptomyces sp. SP17BM10]MEE1787876.1 ABC transporter permease [Streptomyces sp. SP17BM10]